MDHPDKLKEEISWLKTVFAILFVTDLSLIGWIAENYTKVTQPFFYTVIFTVPIIIGIIIWIYCSARRRMKKLNKLEAIQTI